MDFLRRLVGMLIGLHVGLRNVLIVGLARSLLSMLFLNVLHTIPMQKRNFVDYLKQVLTPEAFKVLSTQRAVFC